MLEGYDRLANLGIVQLTVSLALVPVRDGLLSRLHSWLLDAAPEPMFRLSTGQEETAPLRLTIAFGRDERGRWKTMLVPPA